MDYTASKICPQKTFTTLAWYAIQLLQSLGIKTDVRYRYNTWAPHCKHSETAADVRHHFLFELTHVRNSYITSILGFKLSLLLSYLRFMPKGAYRYITFVVILLTVLFHLAFLLVQINLCQPVSARSTAQVAQPVTNSRHRSKPNGTLALWIRHAYRACPYTRPWPP